MITKAMFKTVVHKLHCLAMKYHQERAKANAALVICAEYREALHAVKAEKQELELKVHEYESDYGLLADELKTLAARNKELELRVHDYTSDYSLIISAQYQGKCCDLARLRIKYKALSDRLKAIERDNDRLNTKYARMVAKSYADAQLRKLTKKEA